VRLIARDHRRGWSRWRWLCWWVVARVEEEPTGIPHTGLRGAGSGQEAPDAQNCRYSGSRNHSFDVHRARILPRFDRALLRCRELTGLPVAGTPLCPCRQCLERTLEIAACRRIGSFPMFARAHSRFCENAASSQRPTQATQYRQDDYLLPNEWAQTPGCIRLAVPQVRTSCRSIQNQVAHYPLYRIRKGASFLHARVYQARSWRSPCNRVRRR
jgi:hypothetical protein